MRQQIEVKQDITFLSSVTLLQKLSREQDKPIITVDFDNTLTSFIPVFEEERASFFKIIAEQMLLVVLTARDHMLEPIEELLDKYEIKCDTIYYHAGATKEYALNLIRPISHFDDMPSVLSQCCELGIPSFSIGEFCNKKYLEDWYGYCLDDGESWLAAKDETTARDFVAFVQLMRFRMANKPDRMNMYHSMTRKELLMRASHKIIDLLSIIDKDDQRDIIVKECADVANYVLFTASRTANKE